MIGFQQSDLCHQMREQNQPPEYWKWIKIRGHRRSGFSTTALKLLQQYDSSLIVYPTEFMLQYSRRQALDENLIPSMKDIFRNNIVIRNYLKTHEQIDEKWFIGRRPNRRHQLIIIDQASMIQEQRGIGMYRLREQLFMFCDVLVELN